MPVKKHKLKDSFKAASAHLIALAAHEPGYRLSWAIKQELNWTFIQSEAIHIPKKETDGQFFDVFRYSPDDSLHYYLISNRSEAGFFAAKHRNVDFFFYLTSESHIPETQIKQLIADLKGVSIILTAFSIDLDSFKQKRWLSF